MTRWQAEAYLNKSTLFLVKKYQKNPFSGASITKENSGPISSMVTEQSFFQMEASYLDLSLIMCLRVSSKKKSKDSRGLGHQVALLCASEVSYIS